MKTKLKLKQLNVNSFTIGDAKLMATLKGGNQNQSEKSWCENMN